MKFNFSEEVSGALHFGRPIVALESTVIAHGLPYPQNIDTAYKLERLVRENGAVPATIAIFDGEVSVGLNDEQIEKLATGENIRKVSTRDLAAVAALKLTGATTVATTAFVAKRAGIQVFATGGIGGVHRGNLRDVSADLVELARTPLTVVCSGAKIVLDLAATREWLETFGVTVVGWRCDDLPAFYSRTSGLTVDHRVDDAKAAAAIIKARDELDLQAAILVTVPIPIAAEIEFREIEKIVGDAVAHAAGRKVAGKDLTPFLLAELNKMSGGRTLKANIALLENNAKVAAEIAGRLG